MEAMGIEPVKIIPMTYAVVATTVLTLLLLRGKFNRKAGYAFLIVSAVSGFLFFSPMLPHQFQVLLLGKTKQLGMPMALPAVVLGLFVVFSFAFGRVFCGYVCPAGAVQELAHLVPGRKTKIISKRAVTALRLGFLAAFLISALAFSTGLLRYLGLKEFFGLSVRSGFFAVFLGIVLASVFVYRPFCRLACPYGALLSLAAIKARYKMRRNEKCLNCKRCGEACPTGETGWTDLKQECYMCYRCHQACPTGGIGYTRKIVRESERKPARKRAQSAPKAPAPRTSNGRRASGRGGGCTPYGALQ